MLLKRQWVESRRTFWIASLVLMGSLSLLYTFNILIDAKDVAGGNTLAKFEQFSTLGFRVPMVILFCMLYLAFLSSQFFSKFGKPQTGMSELMLPVTSMERTLSALVLSTLLLVISSILILLMVDAVFVFGLKQFYAAELLQLQQSPMMDLRDAGFPYFYSILPKNTPRALLWAGLGVCSSFTLGSIYFSKLAFLKTGTYLLVLVSIGSMLIGFVKRNFWADYIRVSGTDGIQFIFINAFMVLGVIVLLIWTAIYFRLIEKEL